MNIPPAVLKKNYVADTAVFNEIKGVVDGLESAFRAGTPIDEPEFLRLIDALENIARNGAPPPQSLEFERYVTRARALYEMYENTLERLTAERVASGNEKDFLQSKQLERTFRFAREEARALGIKKPSRICFVGSGYLPESAIAIAEETGCHVTCLDQKRTAVDISKKVIASLGLQDKIEVVHGNGEAFDFGGFDAVWIAVLTKNKNEVVRAVARTNPRAKIACRTVENLRTLLYEPVNEDELAGFSKKKIHAANPDTIMHSLVLVPEK